MENGKLSLVFHFSQDAEKENRKSFSLMPKNRKLDSQVSSYLERVSNVDHKCIREGQNRHPLVIFEDLKPHSATLPLLQHRDRASVRVRAQSQHEVGSRAWWVVVHSHRLNRQPEHLLEHVPFEPQAHCHVLQQIRTQLPHLSRVRLHSFAVRRRLTDLRHPPLTD